MPKSGLIGPFPLTEDAIDAEIEKLSIGAFALGALGGGGKRFAVQRTGRSDKDIGGVLKSFIGAYDAFKYRTYVSTRRAYAKECQLFHGFSPKDTKTHPEPPPNIRVACPDARCEFGE
ncbi:MAG: hypothetical protein HQ503_17375 [Rhodospirillales bacterium]|nr:hypothetical protein [Rhodospirillales bacterium]